MGGLHIGIGFGLKYSTPINRKTNIPPPQEDITDAILLENGDGALIMEDGSYFKIETAKAKRTTRKAKTTTKVDKSYWNF